jgi:hypothetical protein
VESRHIVLRAQLASQRPSGQRDSDKDQFHRRHGRSSARSAASSRARRASGSAGLRNPFRAGTGWFRLPRSARRTRWLAVDLIRGRRIRIHSSSPSIAAFQRGIVVTRCSERSDRYEYCLCTTRQPTLGVHFETAFRHARGYAGLTGVTLLFAASRAFARARNL